MTSSFIAEISLPQVTTFDTYVASITQSSSTSFFHVQNQRYTTYLTNESNIDNLYIFDRPYSIFTSISRYLGCLSRKVFFFFKSSSSYIFPTHLTFSSYRRAVGTKYGGAPLGSQILAGKETQSLLHQKALNRYLPHQIFRYSYGPA